MNRSRAIFSSFNYQYMDRALMLQESVRLHCPDVTFVGILVESKSTANQMASSIACFDNVLFAEDLMIGDFERWIFGHNVVEACTAVKGPALVYLLRSYQEVLYLDPDTYLYSDVEEVWKALQNHDAVLTPHLLTPESTQLGIVDNELSALKHGVYNLGFFAASSTPAGKDAAEWWRKRTHYLCVEDPARGVFTDQRWMDLLPVYFDRVKILKHSGYNVASWNLNGREVALNNEGEITVGVERLVFWHFTKALSDGPLATVRSPGSNALVGALWREYLAVMNEIAKQYRPFPKWSFGYFANGKAIPGALRTSYRADRDLQSRFPSPFANGDELMASWGASKIEPTV